MKRSVAYLLLFICVIGFFAAGMILNTFARTVVMLGFFAGIIAVYVVDGSIARSSELEKKRMEGARYDEVSGDIESSGSDLKVTASSGIWAGFFFLIFGLLCCLPSDDGDMILGRVFFFILAFHAFMVSIPRAGRPVLVLGRSGFEPPEYGFIPWYEVDGIDLIPFTFEWSLIGHILVLHVPGLARYQHQFRPYQALLFKISSKTAKKKLRVMLIQPSEQPNVIRNVADDLLQKSSGREYVWSASVSEKENEVYGRLHELFKTDADLLKRFKKAVRDEDEQIIGQLSQLAAKGGVPADEDLLLLKSTKEARQSKEFNSLIILYLFLLLVCLLFPAWVLWDNYSG